MENNIIITETCSNIRSIARQALKNNWKKAILVSIIYMLAIQLPMIILNGVFGTPDFSNYGWYDSAYNLSGSVDSIVNQMEIYAQTSSLSTIYTLLVSGAFTYGLSLFFLKLFRREDATYADVFAGFQRFGKTLGLFLMMTLIIAIIPMVGIFIMVFGGVLFTQIPFIGGLLMFIGFVSIFLMIIPALMLSQCFFLIIDDKELGIMDALRTSAGLMKGNKGKYFLLGLSFIGWGLLGALASGIISGILFVFANSSVMAGQVVALIASVPLYIVLVYIQTSYVAFYDMLVGRLRPQSQELNLEEPTNMQ